MLNNRLERILCVLCFIGVLCVLELIIRPQEVTLLLQCQAVAGSLIITLIFYCLYKNISKKCIKKKIANMWLKNEYDECLIKIDIYIRKQPTRKWLIAEKALTQAFSGDIVGFCTTKNIFTLNNKLKKNKDHLRLIQMEKVLEYLQTKEIVIFENTFTNNRKTHLLLLYQMLVLFKVGDINSAHSYAELLYNSSILLYKCMACLILAQICKLNHDFESEMLFFQTALKNAPSITIEEYIEEFKI